jgi:hypothetical protein
MEKKQQWTEGIFDTVVDWDSLEKLLRTLTYVELTQLVKMMHGWQNTGTQKNDTGFKKG